MLLFIKLQYEPLMPIISCTHNLITLYDLQTHIMAIQNTVTILAPYCPRVFGSCVYSTWMGQLAPVSHLLVYGHYHIWAWWPALAQSPSPSILFVKSNLTTLLHLYYCNQIALFGGVPQALSEKIDPVS